MQNRQLVHRLGKPFKAAAMSRFNQGVDRKATPAEIIC
jgi:hypothetical protein